MQSFWSIVIKYGILLENLHFKGVSNELNTFVFMLFILKIYVIFFIGSIKL
jgi:hypothetical protein